jgi:hypothetical protein
LALAVEARKKTEDLGGGLLLFDDDKNDFGKSSQAEDRIFFQNGNPFLESAPSLDIRRCEIMNFVRSLKHVDSQLSKPSRGAQLSSPAHRAGPRGKNLIGDFLFAECILGPSKGLSRRHVFFNL